MPPTQPQNFSPIQPVSPPTPVPPLSPPPPPPSNSQSTKIGIVLVGIVLLGLGFWLIQHSRANGDTAATGATSNNAQDSGDTPCFSLTLPTNISSLSSGDCWVTAEYNKTANGSSHIKVEPFAQRKGSLVAQTTAWKAAYKDRYDITAEEPIKVGPYDADKISFKHKNSSDVEASVLIYTADKYAEGEGFELNGDYKPTGDEKQAMDTVIASWQWK